jgi:hypothetical protein
MRLHPVWEKVARWVEKDFERGEDRMRREASTRRIGFWIALAAGFLLTVVYEYGVVRQWQASEGPDPYMSQRQAQDSAAPIDYVP